MTDYGVTATGFVLKPQDVILDEIKAYQLANISPSLDVSDDSVIGQINGIMSSKLAELWEVAAAVYSSQYPDSATGVPLDNVGSLSGADRLEATKSAVTVTVTGTPATVLPVGRIMSTDPAGDRFTLTAEVTIPGGGSIDGVFEAEEFGPIRANAGTLTVIETPVSGWASGTNALDAELGRDVETDEAFRLRRELTLAAPASATVEAIRAQVLEVDNVTTCSVYENNTEITDSEGRPAKSVEVVVEDGDDTEIAEAIFTSKAGGIRAYGTTDSEVVTDDQGTSHTIEFTRPSDVRITTYVEILFDDDVPEAEKADRLAAAGVALAEFIDALPVGQDVIRSRLFQPVFDSVEGIADVVQLLIAIFPAATSTANLTITNRQRATGDSSDMDVVEA